MPTTTAAPAAPKLIAFHGKKSVQDKYLKRVRSHAAADEIVKGRYWEDGKGCAIGCTLHSGNHSAYETELGIPTGLARLEDIIFERLPNELAMTWPARFLAAPKVGADLSLVELRLWHCLLIDEKMGALTLANTPGSKKVIGDLGVLIQRWIDGDVPDKSEFESVAAAAAAESKKAWDAYYAACNDNALALARDLDLDLDLARDLDLDLALARDLALALARDLARALARDLALALARDLARALARDRDLTYEQFFALVSEKLLSLMAEAPVVKS